MAATNSSGPAQRPQAASRGHRPALRVIALATVIHMLRSRRFYERVIAFAVVVAALARISQENRASTMARLADWDKRQVQRLERKARAHGRAVQSTGQMMRSEVSGRTASMRDRTG
jgi:Tfp pilus assembly major pilin PilA